MTETIKEGDFVEIDYTGVLKGLDLVFDTTVEAEATKNEIHDPKMSYGPVAICIGQGQILQGLDSALVGLEIGQRHEVVLPPEQAFGKKDGKLMKLVPTSIFKKQNINPMVGLQVQIDGTLGTIRTVTGGRTVVDFNHPFAGKEVLYRVNIIRKITDDKDKVMALIELALNQKREAINIEVREGKATITLKADFPAELLETLKERIKNVLSSIKDVEFKTPKKTGPKEETKKAETENKPAEKQEKEEKQV
jgi:FKBP-type peptidyl-prolyl cis-trans isomerase 2